MYGLCLESGLCAALEFPRSQSYTKRELAVRRCKNPIVYAYSNIVTRPTAPSMGLLLRQPVPPKGQSLVEGVWPMSDESAATLLHTVWEREMEAWGKQLLDVRTADVLGLLDLNNSKDLKTSIRCQSVLSHRNVIERTWIERKRARCLAAISWYKLLTASARLRSRNSLYMLCVPERES